MNRETCQFGCRGSSDRTGVLIAQLGTPNAPTPSALRLYLKQFLSDPRVIEGNRAVWWVVLNGIILRTRPRRSSRLYSRIWREQGSPLLLITQRQTELVRDRLRAIAPNVEVEFGMRYGTPSLEAGVDRLLERGCSKILLFPMYPQYSATTTASTYDAVFRHVLARRWVPTVRVAEPYYAHPAYIEALAHTLNRSIAALDFEPERLVLSYHGIPEKYVEKGDPYCCQCNETTAALLPRLSLPTDKVIHTFQSRFGKDPWLRPYTDETLEQLGRDGIKRIAVCAPGFTADCLETLDELGHEGREQFERSGGERYALLPCLNDQDFWIRSMTDIIREELGSWIAGSARNVANCDIVCPLKRAV